jgi:large subunit ribosomal protein L2
MALKQFDPVTPSQRSLVLIDRAGLWKGRPEKSLTSGGRRSAGRNNKGHITAPHRGGGHKQLYRVIDFKRNTDGKAVVERIEYDPNRSAFIALIRYEKTSQLAYIIAPQRLAAGDVIESGIGADIKPGNALPLKAMPVGTVVHNVELKPGRGGQMARAAGSFAQLVGKEMGYALLRLRSGEVRLVRLDCMATVGAVSNPDNQNQIFGKAGRSRWMGRRPHVRGVAMNPVDHPLGGGEGKTSGGRHPVSRTGKPAKGKRTRRRVSTNQYIVHSRHKK